MNKKIDHTTFKMVGGSKNKSKVKEKPLAQQMAETIEALAKRLQYQDQYAKTMNEHIIEMAAFAIKLNERVVKLENQLKEKKDD